MLNVDKLNYFGCSLQFFFYFFCIDIFPVCSKDLLLSSTVFESLKGIFKMLFILSCNIDSSLQLLPSYYLVIISAQPHFSRDQALLHMHFYCPICLQSIYQYYINNTNIFIQWEQTVALNRVPNTYFWIWLNQTDGA